jgi:deoxyadenosine/deoxycytidine kinase
MIVCINGNIGSGKSTLLKKLKEEGYAVYFEGLDRGTWGDLLEKYYENPKRYSYLFQTVVLADMRELYNIIRLTHREDEIVFVERSHIDCLAFCTMIKDEGNMKQEEFEAFERLFNLLYVSPDIYVTLNIPPSICLDRLQYRGRKSESSITMNYLRRVEKYTSKCMEMDLCQGKKYTIDGKGKSPSQIKEKILRLLTTAEQKTKNDLSE